MKATAAAALLLQALAAPAGAEPPPDAARQRELVRTVRQDCGACHGLRLTGGLGPALQPGPLSQWPTESLAAVVRHGRPGTPMPGWAPMLSTADARWIAEQLQRGFPELP